MPKKSQNCKPFDAAEKAAIIKDYESGRYTLERLVHKYRRGWVRIRAVCRGLYKTKTATDLQTINKALSYSNKETGIHSALFKQIFALVKQQAPDVHRVTLDVESRQITFETLTAHKVTL